VIANGTLLKFETQPQSSVSRFYDVEYPIAPALLRDRQMLTVRFQAAGGLEVTPVFAIRIIKR